MITEKRLIKILRKKFRGNHLSLRRLSQEVNCNFDNLHTIAVRLKNRGIISFERMDELGRKGPLDIEITDFVPPQKESILKHPLVIYIIYPLIVALVIFVARMIWVKKCPTKIDMTPQEIETQNRREKKISVTKIKINRYLEDYKLNIKELMQKHFKESSRIASNMSSRGTGRSGMHIKAHMDHAKETKKKIDSLSVKLTRDIEDVLLEHLDIHNLSEISELKEEYEKYNYEEGQIKDLYKRLVDSAQSWEARIEGKVNITENFSLE